MTCKFRIKRAGDSFRMQSKIAVEVVSGSELSTRMLDGRITAVGSLKNWHSSSPIMAFQKPTTIQGRVSANSPSKIIRTKSGLSAVRVWCARYSINAAVLSESAAKMRRLWVTHGATSRSYSLIIIAVDDRVIGPVSADSKGPTPNPLKV